MTDKIVVFELNTSCGFFSIFFHLCQAYIYASKNNIPFYIINNNWAYTYKIGWHDYFTTLTLYTPSQNTNITCKHGSMPCYIPKYTNREYINCIKDIFKLNSDIVANAEHYVHNVIQGDFIYIYVRRGDKFTETKFISESDILKKISNIGDFNKVFIQSDDYTVVENFRQLLPTHSVYSLVPDKKRGHYQSMRYINMTDTHNKYKNVCTSFNDLNDRDIVYSDVIEMMTGILIATKAKHCWTDSSSNVGRFIKLFSFDNTLFYNTDKPVNLDASTAPYWSI
jgi:hypothetical protein